MNTTELLAVFRQEVFDLETPYLWSDALVYTYIDEAQKQFCRDTYGIEDSSSFTLAIAIGTEWYAIDPRILKIRSAVNSATGKPVDLIAVEKMDTSYMKFDGAQGPIKALITGLDKGFVRAYPVPNEAATINLRTFVLPATVTSVSSFVIDDQHVPYLLHWVKYRAYYVQDADARDEKKADNNKAMWDAYCAKAKVEQSRARRPVSTVTYGGI